MKEIINYKKFVEKIGIKKNDKILINSNFLRIMILAKKKKIFNLTKLVNAILNRLGSGGIFLDIDYKDSFTFVHLAEQKIGVNYRFKRNLVDTFTEILKKKKIQHICTPETKYRSKRAKK